MPIGRPPHLGHGRKLRTLFADGRLEAHMLPMTKARKFIHDRPARIVTVVIHTAQIDEKIETQGRLGMLANLGDALGVGDSHGDFAPEFEGLRD